jgi:hypothetical protein
MNMLRASHKSFSDKSCAVSFAPIVVLYIVAFVFLAWPWLSGAVTIPWDAKAQSQAQLQFLATSFAHGQSPFWTPNLFAGWPQIADPQSLIFSPLHLLLAALDPTPSFREADLVTFAYLFAGGLAVMLFCRDRGWHDGAALVAALIFTFGGSAYSRIQHTSEIISLAYTPIALWLLARTLERASWRYGVAAGLAIALLMIGRDQVAMLALYVLALYVLAWWLDGAAHVARIGKTVLPLAACGATALVIAFVPLLLTALLAADSNRPSITYEHAAGGSLHPVLLLMLVFSDLYGAADPDVPFWGPPSLTWHNNVGPSMIALAQNMGEIYCGILAVLLILGTGVIRGRLWAREIRFFAFALVLVLFYAFGWYTPAFHLMYDVVPGVDLFRRPADGTFIIGLLIAILTGYLVHRVLSGTAEAFPGARSSPLHGPSKTGVNALMASGEKEKGRRATFDYWGQIALECALIAALAAIAIAVAYRAASLDVAVLPIATGLAFAAGGIALLAALRRIAPARQWLATALVAGFVIADLAWNNAPNESTGLPPERYEALKPQGHDETVALLKAKLAQTVAPDRRDRVELIGIAYHWPDVALAQGFDHLFGHNPLRLRDFKLATGVGDTVAETVQRPFAPLYPSYRSTFADLAGVRFIATGVPVEQIDPKLKEGDLIFIARTADAYVYEDPRALPRVMLVPDYRIADFDDLIRDGWPGVDPRRVVLLQQAAAPLLPAAPAPATAPGREAAAGTARILRYANTEVDVEVNAPAGGFLLLTDVWHPWWRARVDGRPAEILKADVVFRAVAVGPGLHRVVFTFEPFRGAWEELKEKIAEASSPDERSEIRDRPTKLP